MKLSYRNQKNAQAISQFWGKPLNKPDWYKIEALSEDESEIMIYDVVGWPYNDASELVRNLNSIKTKTITVRINSPGGDVFDGIAIYNALKNHSSKVITRNEGLAASIASIIAMAGKEIQAYSNAMLMIHNAWTYAAGDASLMREIADLLEQIDGNLLDIYVSQAKIGKKETKAMMDAETWMTAKEAKEKGFIDTVLESGKATKAQFDLSVFNNVPDDLLANEASHKKPTEREIEKALRESGLSKNQAQAVLARGWKAICADEAVIEAVKKTLEIIGGSQWKN
jgi:ATP-dependent Clp endopeptidase proteolytic subunit ClpP